VWRQNFALVPFLGQLVQHVRDFSELVFLVDWAQIRNHQIRERDRFRPATVEFNHRELDILSTCINSGALVLEKTGQLLTQLERNWYVLLLQGPGGTEPVHVTIRLNHDDSVRKAGCDLDCLFSLLHSLNVERTW